MKQLNYILLILMIMASQITSAQSTSYKYNPHMHEGLSINKQVPDAQGASCENTIDVSVNGLVCDFCARALEKVFGQREDVAGIDVDLNAGKVKIAMQPGATIDDDTVTRLITDSGYNVVNIEAGCDS